MRAKIEKVINDIFESSDDIDVEYICSKLDSIKEFDGTLDEDVMGDPDLTTMIREFLDGKDSAKLEIANYIISNLKLQGMATFSATAPKKEIVAEELGISMARDRILELIKIPFDKQTRDQILNLNNHEIRYVLTKVNNRIDDIVLILSAPGFPIRIYSKLNGVITLLITNRCEVNNSHMIWSEVVKLFDSEDDPTILTLQQMLCDFGFNYELTSELIKSNLTKLDIQFDAVAVVKKLFNIDLNNPKINCYTGINNTVTCLVEDRNLQLDSATVIIFSQSEALEFEVPSDYARVRSRILSNLYDFDATKLNSFGLTVPYKVAQMEIPPFELDGLTPALEGSKESSTSKYRYTTETEIPVEFKMWNLGSGNYILKFTKESNSLRFEISTSLPELKLFCMVIKLIDRHNTDELKTLAYKVISTLSSEITIK